MKIRKLKLLAESRLPQDPISQEKINTRVRDLSRLAAHARAAAKKAEEQNKEELAVKLNTRAEELEELTDKIYQDSLNNNSAVSGKNSQEQKQPDKSKEKDNSEEEQKNKGKQEEPSEESQEQDPEDSKEENPKSSDKSSEQETNNSKQNNTGKEDSSNSKSKQNKNQENSGEPNEPGVPDGKKDPNESGSPDEPGKPSDLEDPGEQGDQKDPNEPGEQEQQENENEEDKQSDANDPIKNPFADDEDIPTGLPGQSDKKPRDASLDDIIKILQDLSGEARQGATDGLKDLLNKKSSLQEAINKKLTDMDDDEYGDLVNSTLDLIDQVDSLPEVDDIEDRITKINKRKDNIGTSRALKDEDNVNRRPDFQAKKARDAENDKYRNYPSIRQFELDFFDSIRNQVAEVKKLARTYDEINNEYEGENIVVKADVIKRLPEQSIPIIDFYFDVSGSWTNHPDAIEIGKRAVATVKEFEDRGEVKLNIYYFGDRVSTNMYDRGVWGANTTAWDEILQNIKATDAKNVVLMTDGDMAGQARFGPTCVVEGEVWFIWSLYDYKCGSKQIIDHLNGKSGNSEYTFGSGGWDIPDYN